MKTLGFTPKISDEYTSQAVTVNLQSKYSTKWLYGRFVFSIIGCYTIGSYFSQRTNDQDSAVSTLDILTELATEKFIFYCIKFKQFHELTSLRDTVDLIIYKVIHGVVIYLFKYLTTRVKDSIYQDDPIHSLTFRWRMISIIASVFAQNRSQFR